MGIDLSTGKTQIQPEELTTAPIPTTVLSDGEFIGFRIHVPSGQTLSVFLVGVQNNSNSAPAGLTAEVDDETNTTNLVSRNSKRATGEPLASVDGAVDVIFAIENDTGGEQNATGNFGYRIQ